MSDLTIRLATLAAGILLLLAIVWFSRPRDRQQGRRFQPAQEGAAPTPQGTHTPINDGRPEQADLNLRTSQPAPGERLEEGFDKIVSLFVAARAGQLLHGPDIVVAAEKTGLTFGHMNVFHRLIDHQPQRGPVFSMANIVKPGSFEMSEIHTLETPALAFFLTLPAPVSALEAWDMMLPAVQRIAELLDGVVLDEDRNALGRQRIAHLRDELRAYDRERQAPLLDRGRRW